MFVRSYNPIWYFVNLQGVQMDDTYYFFVLENDFPYLPSTVYHDPEHTIPWNFPIQLLPNGTLPADIYYDPDLVYRLEWRRGNTQADALIYEVLNYVPGSAGSTPTPGDEINSDNQISNSQFSIVDFDPSMVITTAGTYEIAPGWFLKLTGTGTVSTTITQEAIAGNQNITGNPPYRLKFVNTGWTEALLYQRFQNAGGLWANEFINASLTGISESGTLFINLSYVPSTGTPIPITSLQTISNSVYSVVGGGVSVGTSTNSDSGDSAYVDFVITLPPTGTFKISNIQLISGGSSLETTNPLLIPYIQETLERQVDHLFYYYKPELFYKPIPSFLVGWDFPFNPAQFGGSTQAATAIGANKSKYVWDQTIIFQSANSGVGVTRGTAGELLLTAAATTQMAVIQYLGASHARKILNAPCAVNISAMTSVVAGVAGTVSLWYTTDASLPNIAAGTNNSLVLTLDSAGKPATFNGTWIEVPRRNKQSATFTVETSSNTNFNDYMLNEWDLAGIAGANTATFFAIVVGFASVASPQTIGINSISLNAGEIATRPAPQTYSDVLRECQFYYEKSYEPSTALGATTEIGQRIYPTQLFDNGGGAANVYKGNFNLQFLQVKRAIPTMTFYSPPTGTAARIAVGVWGVGGYSVGSPEDINVTEWTAHGASTSGVGMFSNNVSIAATIAFTIGFQGSMTMHYLAEARLGIV